MGNVQIVQLKVSRKGAVGRFRSVKQLNVLVTSVCQNMDFTKALKTYIYLSEFSTQKHRHFLQRNITKKTYVSVQITKRNMFTTYSFQVRK